MRSSLLLLFLPLLTTGKPQSSSDEDYDYDYEDEELFNDEEEDVVYVLPVTHNECPSGAYECVLQNNCTTFLEEKDELTALTSGTEEYNQLFANLEKQVCNKENKGVCCIDIGERYMISIICLVSPFECFKNLVFRSALFQRVALCCQECHYNFRKKRCVRNSNNRRCPC